MPHPISRAILPALLVGCSASPKKSAPPPGETVVLLHGLGRTPKSLAGLGRRLEAEGFRVESFGYASLRSPIEAHGARLRADLEALDADPSVTRVHLVGHSLGGIVARHALTLSVPRKMGRVVMLAPPNAGSSLARRLAPVLGDALPPLRDLSDAPGSFVRGLGTPGGVEVGVIAARWDEKVRRSETHLPGETDHVVVPGLHGVPFAPRELAAQVAAFLRAGRFLRRPAGAPAVTPS